MCLFPQEDLAARLVLPSPSPLFARKYISSVIFLAHKAFLALTPVLQAYFWPASSRCRVERTPTILGLFLSYRGFCFLASERLPFWAYLFHIVAFVFWPMRHEKN